MSRQYGIKWKACWGMVHAHIKCHTGRHGASKVIMVAGTKTEQPVVSVAMSLMVAWRGRGCTSSSFPGKFACAPQSVSACGAALGTASAPADIPNVGSVGDLPRVTIPAILLQSALGRVTWGGGRYGAPFVCRHAGVGRRGQLTGPVAVRSAGNPQSAGEERMVARGLAPRTSCM